MYQCCHESCRFNIGNEKIMRLHVRNEHGPHSNYVEVLASKDSKQFGEKPIKRGQTICSSCFAAYNNRTRPEICDCGKLLSAKIRKHPLNPHKLTEDLFSVRRKRSGINKRIIVDIKSKICYDTECFENRSHFPDITQFKCEHLKSCCDSRDIVSATVIEVKLSKLKKVISDAEFKEIKTYIGEESQIKVFMVSDNIMVLPALKPKSHECQSGLLHIDLSKLKCPIRRCSAKPRYHFLVKAELMCLHILLCKLARNGPQLQSAVRHSSLSHSFQFSKQKTVENIIENIVENVPSPLDEEEEKIFLQKSFQIQNQLFLSTDISEYDERICKICSKPNILRKRRSGSICLLVTPGFMKEVCINMYMCKSCDLVYHPNMYKIGFVPVCDNLLVSWSYLVKARDQILNGNKMYKYFSTSLRRLCVENDKLSAKVNKLDFHNLSVRLTKLAVAYNSASLLRSFEDGHDDCLAQVLCLHCGIAPITLMSDGNAKNSIFFRGGSENLVVDDKDESEILSLDKFLRKCIVSVTGSGLYQHFVKEKINILKIPPIISRRLCGEVRNRENLKKSVFNKKIDLASVDFSRLTKMIKTGEFNLLKSRMLSLKQLRKISKKLKIPMINKQSKIMLENIILELFDWMIGGNSNCHQYTHSIGETGGWTDTWCIHNVKYGSKKMILQESVVDPADIYLSLLFPPALQILDDPCTFINHLFCTEENLSDILFGANRGCFEPPDEVNAPQTDHDFPHILPLSLNPRRICIESLNNPVSKIHPITKTMRRLVLGTKLSESHKKQNECLFHNVNNCLQSTQIKGESNIQHFIINK